MKKYIRESRRHTTHFACNEMLEKYGGKTVGCCCTGHECGEPDYTVVMEPLNKCLVQGCKQKDCLPHCPCACHGAERDERKKMIAEDICKMIDDIEMSYSNTSLEGWKAFKHIRNAIRDKYVLKK